VPRDRGTRELGHGLRPMSLLAGFALRSARARVRRALPTLLRFAAPPGSVCAERARTCLPPQRRFARGSTW